MSAWGSRGEIVVFVVELHDIRLENMSDDFMNSEIFRQGSCLLIERIECNREP